MRQQRGTKDFSNRPQGVINNARDITKKDLSAPKKRLLELMREIHFGCIKRLVILNGEPVLDPLPEIVYTVKFSGAGELKPETKRDNFVLKAELSKFFANLDGLQNGTIERLEIKHGLPVLMDVLKNSLV